MRWDGDGDGADVGDDVDDDLDDARDDGDDDGDDPHFREVISPAESAHQSVGIRGRKHKYFIPTLPEPKIYAMAM